MLRRYDLRVRAAQGNAMMFLEDIQQHRYDGLCLRATEGRRGALCPTAGHLKAPHYSFDPDACAVVLSPVRRSLSFWPVYDCLVQCPGLAAVSWPSPNGPALTRAVRARFASPSQASAALQVLGLMREAPWQPARLELAALLSKTEQFSAFVAPPEMAKPERIAADVCLSAEVVRKLDNLVGVPADITSSLLGQEMPDELKLDLQVLYLRRVHHFCFYAAAWCVDEWELRERCGTAVLRDVSNEAAVNKPEQSDEGEWAHAHEQRVKNFLATAACQRPQPPTAETEPVAGRVMDLMQASTLKIAEGKFRCTRCGKHFRGCDYVQKHFRKMHGDAIQVLLHEARQQAAEAAYIEDPQRPRFTSRLA